MRRLASLRHWRDAEGRRPASWPDPVVSHLNSLPMMERARSSRMLTLAAKQDGRTWSYVLRDREQRVARDDYLLRLAGYLTVVTPALLRDQTYAYTLSAHHCDATRTPEIELSLRLPIRLSGAWLRQMGSGADEAVQSWWPVDGPITSATVRPLNPSICDAFGVGLYRVGSAPHGAAFLERWMTWAVGFSDVPVEDVPVIGGHAARAHLLPRGSWAHAWLAPAATIVLTLSTDRIRAQDIASELLSRPETRVAPLFEDSA